MAGFFEQLVLGDDDEQELPSSRKEQFFYILKTNFRQFIGASIFSSIFFIPLVITQMIISYSKSVALLSLDTTSSLYNDMFDAVVMHYQSMASIAVIITLMIGFIGLSGLYQVMMDMVTGRLLESTYTSFVKGIRRNLKMFICFGLILGLSLMTLRLGMLYVSSVSDVTFRYILYVLLILQLLMIVIGLFYAMTGTTLYTNTLGQLVLNSYKLALSHMIQTIGFVLLLAIPVILFYFINSPTDIIILAILPWWYLGLVALAQCLYSMKLFDLYIQPSLGQAFVCLGLKK